ncbi:hypothetical protein K438DRAFT_1872081 [Mycena galopus ATCC 62051]|nr:hypothetical protein K438DRAFT_1872081 [Mycena galopus ATCC 62051]
MCAVSLNGISKALWFSCAPPRVPEGAEAAHARCRRRWEYRGQPRAADYQCTRGRRPGPETAHRLRDTCERWRCPKHTQSWRHCIRVSLAESHPINVLRVKTRSPTSATPTSDLPNRNTSVLYKTSTLEAKPSSPAAPTSFSPADHHSDLARPTRSIPPYSAMYQTTHPSRQGARPCNSGIIRTAV